MNIKFLLFFLIINVSVTQAQGNELINDFIKSNGYEVDNYIVFKIKNNDDEILPLMSILRVDCSNCYDYLIFQNNDTVKIFNPIEIKKINDFASQFLINVSDDDYYYYLNTIVTKYQDAIKVNKMRSVKTKIVKKLLKKYKFKHLSIKNISLIYDTWA